MEDNKQDVYGRIFFNDSNGEYWFGNEGDVPSNYRPIGWVKKNEDRLYINNRDIEIIQHPGKPPEIIQTDSLDENATKSDLMPVIMDFLEDRDDSATMLELDHYIEQRGFDPSGSCFWVGNEDSAVKFWKGDEEYIKAILQLISDREIIFFWQFNRQSKYSKHAQELGRTNPVMRYQIAKRYGEYSYKRRKWRPITVKKKE
jgi:hypothetical protein